MFYPGARFSVILSSKTCHRAQLWVSCVMRGSAQGRLQPIDSNNAVELYNLKDDIGEHHNLAASHTAKRDELLDDLLKWMESVKAPMPSQKNPAYAPDKPVKPGKKKNAPE